MELCDPRAHAGNSADRSVSASSPVSGTATAIARTLIDAPPGSIERRADLAVASALPDVSTAYRGQEGARCFYDDICGPWEELLIEVDHIIDHGDRLVALLHFHCRGREGIELPADFGHGAELRDGLVSVLSGYASWPEALEAGGMGADCLETVAAKRPPG